MKIKKHSIKEKALAKGWFVTRPDKRKKKKTSKYDSGKGESGWDTGSSQYATLMGQSGTAV